MHGVEIQLLHGDKKLRDTVNTSACCVAQKRTGTETTSESRRVSFSDSYLSSVDSDKTGQIQRKTGEWV